MNRHFTFSIKLIGKNLIVHAVCLFCLIGNSSMKPVSGMMDQPGNGEVKPIFRERADQPEDPAVHVVHSSVTSSDPDRKLSLFSSSNSGQSIFVQNYYPRNNSVVSGTIPIRVQVNSTNPVRSVIARIGIFKAELTAMSVMNGYPPNNYQGVLEIMNYAYDEKIDLVILATDDTGYSDSLILHLTYDPPPAVSIITPIDQSVARPTLPFRIYCRDRDTCNILIHFGEQNAMNKQIMYSGTIADSMSAVIDMSAANGKAAILYIDIWDKRSQHTLKGVFVHVDTSSALKEFYSGDRSILDFNYNRLLLIDSAKSPSYPGILELASKNYTSIPLKIKLQETGNSYITPYGAILNAKDSSVLNSAYNHAYEWSRDSLVALGPINSASSLSCRGDLASWSLDKTLMVRNLQTRRSSMIDDQVGNWNNDLTERGEIAYWRYGSTLSIWLYKNGSSSLVAPGTSTRWNTNPRTDGRRIVYMSHDTCCNYPNNAAIEYHDGKNSIVLSRLNQDMEIYGLDIYACKNGNIAYISPSQSGDAYHVWLRDTLAHETRVSYEPLTSRIESLDSNGNLVLISGKKRIYAPKYGAVQVIGTDIGKLFVRESGIFIAMGKTMYKVDLPTPYGLFAGFSGKKESDGNSLSWISQQYVGSVRYEVQRSRDGNFFQSIGSVPVVNEPDKVNQYMYKDIAPPSTGNLYRLKMVFFDSTFRYSPVVVLNNADIMEVDVYPNPVGNNLNLYATLAHPGRLKIQILSAEGAMFHYTESDTMEGVLIKQIPVSFLRPGTYHIRFIAEKETRVVSFIKI